MGNLLDSEVSRISFPWRWNLLSPGWDWRGAGLCWWGTGGYQVATTVLRLGWRGGGGEGAGWHRSGGSPREERGPAATLLLGTVRAPALRRHRENLGKRQLDEDKTRRACEQAQPGTPSLQPWLRAARLSQTLSWHWRKAVVGFPQLRSPDVFLKFSLQLERLMCQQVTECISSLWLYSPAGRTMPAVVPVLPSSPDMPFPRTAEGPSADAATGCHFVLLCFAQLRRSISHKVCFPAVKNKCHGN